MKKTLLTGILLATFGVSAFSANVLDSLKYCQNIGQRTGNSAETKNEMTYECLSSESNAIEKIIGQYAPPEVVKACEKAGVVDGIGYSYYILSLCLEIVGKDEKLAPPAKSK